MNVLENYQTKGSWKQRPGAGSCGLGLGFGLGAWVRGLRFGVGGVGVGVWDQRSEVRGWGFGVQYSGFRGRQPHIGSAFEV